MSAFTRADAQTIIALVQEAPLRNMRAAQEVTALLQRFAAFADAHFDAPKNVTPARRGNGKAACTEAADPS